MMLNSIRSFSVARFYRAYLARYLIFQKFKEVVLAILGKSYQLRCLFKQSCECSTKIFTGMGSFCSEVKCKEILVESVQTLQLARPNIFDEASYHIKNAGPVELKMPAIKIIELINAAITGSTSFIQSGDHLIHHDLYKPERDTSPAETYGIIERNTKTGDIKLCTSKPKIRIKCAINLVGQSTYNYAHYLTETLPRLAIAETYMEYKSVPLLIDSNLHENMYEAVRLLSDRDILKLEQWDTAKVDRLIDISPVGYEPYIPHRIGLDENEIIVNKFSPAALDILRQAIRKALQGKKAGYSEKLYLRRSDRSSLVRSIINSDEVEEIIKGYEFDILEPGAMSFADQAVACVNAEYIISPVGAALSNMIFAPRGCKIIALAPYYEDGNYYYYSNLAGVLGHELIYCLGMPDKDGGHPRHRNYHMDIDKMEQVMKNLVH